MDNFDLHSLLTFQENNMEFDLLCPNGYNNNLNEMDIHLFSKFFNNNVNFATYFEPFNENFADMDLLTQFELPFNDSFTDINISPNLEPSDNNFTDINISPNLKPFDDNFIGVDISPNLEPSDDNFTDINISPNFELLSDDLESTSNNSYQYNLAVGDHFDDWASVDTFIHKYCLERGFDYQICRSDRDPNDSTIRRKSFKCSSSGYYEARKMVDHTLH
jgi:hypothetical protein